jgi:hypothetical protein
MDQGDGETHGNGQRLIQCIATGNMPADLMDPVNIGFNLRLFRIHEWQSFLIIFGVGSDSANPYSPFSPIAA